MWTALLPLLGDVLDRIIPDPEQREKAKLELLKQENSDALQALQIAATVDVAQANINQAEAAGTDKFASRWRPFIGWVCGIAFAYHFIVQPFMAFTLAAFGQPVSLPSFDMDTLFTVLLGMLGLGTMRSVERVKGVKL